MALIQIRSIGWFNLRYRRDNAFSLGVYDECPFCIARVESKNSLPYSALWVSGFPNLSVAVKNCIFRFLYPVYEARRKSGTKAVINIDYRHPGRA
jgi:hypothetical protein